jgi:hypothetical protein
MSAAVRRVALGLAVALAAFASLLVRGDGPPPEDADLMALPPPIPDHENGFIALIGAAGLLQWPEDEATSERLAAMARGERWDDALAVSVLAANEHALAAFTRASRASAFQSPPIRDIRADVPDMLPWLQLAQASALRAIAASRRGEAQAAIDGALAAVRLGGLVAGNPNGALLSGTSGLRIGRTGLGALEGALPVLAEAPEAGARLIAELDGLHIDPERWRGMWASEYRTVRSLERDESAAAIFDEYGRSSMRWVATWLPELYVYQPNNSWASYLQRVRARMAAAGAACAPSPSPPERVSDFDLLLPNGAGRLAASESIPLTNFDASRCAFDTHVALLRAALALLAFERDRGSLPPSLEALVPAYLPSAPRDGFAESPLQLDRRRRTIFSAGSEGAGLAADDAERRALRLVLPAPAPR